MHNLPGRKSIATNSMTIADHRIGEAKELIRANLLKTGGSVITDYGKRLYDYIVVVATFFDKDWR